MKIIIDKLIFLKACHWTLVILVVGSNFSCRKFVELPRPTTQLDASAVFASEATAKAAISSLYTAANNLTAGGLNSASITGCLSADEMDLYSTGLNDQQIWGNQMLSNNSYANNLWLICYTIIYQCNAILEGVENNTQLSSTLISQMQGEALFFRALSHYYLTAFYENIPLVQTTDYRKNTNIAQDDHLTVLKSVANDLEKAAGLLPVDFNKFAGERLYASKWAALAVLSRVQLEMGKYNEAIQIASDIIASPLFGLPAMNDAFIKNSKEAIFQTRGNSTTMNTSEGNRFVLTARPLLITLSVGFYNGFESGDGRRNQWIGKYTSGGIDYYYPYKYKVKTASAYSEYSTILRTAEQYLLRAEAYALSGQSAMAIDDLNSIRQRAGLPLIVKTPLPSTSALLNLILRERRAELFSEWGHRWLDLRRFGKIDEVMSAIKPNWKRTAAIFPIPAGDISVNPNLKQNPGYNQ